MKISDIDKNFLTATSIKNGNVTIYDVCDAPFAVYGLIKPQNKDDIFRRLPDAVANAVNEGIKVLHKHTAGGRVCFATNSKHIAIHAQMNNIGKMPHMPFTGSTGFDLYKKEAGKERYIHTFTPPIDIQDSYESDFNLSGEMADFTLNFPLYSGVSRLYIILDADAELNPIKGYKPEPPIVYYGSSITQGGCASRPGNSYQSIISRKNGYDYINLGFSGSALGEKAIAEYIAGLDMSAFIYDYDYNAPDPEHLENTHEAMFKIIRKANPTLPIICVSAPSEIDNRDTRRNIIRKTVENAASAGDKNVHFLDGADFASEFSAGDSLTVDTCHPNDLGFWCMASVIGAMLDKIL